MNSKTSLLLIFLFTFTTSLLQSNSACSLTQTTITFNPRQSYPSAGQSLTINAAVLDVTNLSAWQLLIGFNPSIINCTDVTIPPDNIFDGNYILFPPEINNTKGYAKIFCVLNGTHGVNGSGTLCQINFQCLTPGVTALEIIQLSCIHCSTYLQESGYNLIPFISEEGAVEVTEQGFQENWFNLETQPILIFSNSTITAFQCNETWKEITFNAIETTGTYGSTTAVTPKSIINGTKIMVLINNTPVSYSLSKNTTHNFIHFTYQHSTKNIKIQVTLLGDVNGDRKVRVDDVLFVALRFGTDEGGPPNSNGYVYDPIADLAPVPDGDGKIRVDDVLLAVGEFGKEWTP